MSLVIDHAAARRIVEWQTKQDEKSELRCMYEVPRIQKKIAEEIAKEIAIRNRSREKAETGPLSPIKYDATTDRYRFLTDGDSNDLAPPDSIFNEKLHLERVRFSEAEADYKAVCVEQTGVEVTPEEWARQKAERSEIRRQSHVLAHMLETAGTIAYRDDAFQLWIWHVHSCEAEKIPNFRRICFLPYIAAIVRSSKLAALEYFLQRHPFCRFWTFTSGQRVGIDGLGERVSNLSERLNALNKELYRLYGVQIVFRSTELGTVEFDAANRAQADSGSIEFDENGEPLFHVHAHCVVYSTRGFLSPARWKEMVNFVHGHWEHHWDAGDIIRDARECCKYVTKPGDMLKLSPAQLARVEAQLHGKRLVAPLRTLAKEIRARKLAGKCLRRQKTHDGMIWREALDHNKHAERDAADTEAAFALHQAEVKDRIDANGMKGETETAPLRWRGVGQMGRRHEGMTAPCKVLARLAPAVGPRGIKEPRVIVGGSFVDRTTINNHPLVERLWMQTLEAWEDGLRISVHTGTPIGEARPLSFLPDLPERMKPASAPVWEVPENVEFAAN
ncbi:MAG TPA: hypothetical protein VL357_12830 [Rariglobus sp.]|nr:hypothetical protein [Rariglobus sp.]